MHATRVQDGRAAVVALILVVAAVAVLLPGAMNRWVLPKDALLAVAAVAAALAPARGRLPRWLVATVLGACILLLVAALAGAAPWSQMLGRWPRYEGLVTIPVYVAAAWIGARLLGPSASASRIRVFTASLAVLSILVGGVALLEAFGLRPIPADLDRPGSLLGNATDQGIVGVMLAALLVLPALRPASAPVRLRMRVLVAVGAAFAILTVVTSASRAAVGALLVVAVVLGVVDVARTPRRRWLRAGAWTVGIVIVALLALAVPLTRDRLAAATGASASSVGDRAVIWGEALRLLGGSPVLGVGPNGYLDAIAEQHSPTWFAEVGSGVTIDSPHMWLLQAALAGGVLLAVGAAAFTVAVLVVGVRRSRALATGETVRSQLLLGSTVALVGYGLILLTHFTAPSTTILAALLVGAVVSVPERAAPIGSPRLRGAGVAALAVWAAALLVTCFAELPMNVGVEAAARGDVRSADSAFAAAAAMRPWDADVQLIAAQSLAAAADAAQVPGTGAAELALSWSTRAAERLPDSVLAAKALATAQLDSGDPRAAATTLRALDALAPNDPETLHRLGGALYLAGDPEGSLEALQHASTLQPTDRDIWLTLQFVAEQLGDEQTATRAAAALAQLPQ